LHKLQARKPEEEAKSQTRVSTSDPQARVMKQSDGGLALSYNAQISTDATHGLIVGVAVTQEANDSAQLLPAVDRVEERLKKKPQQVVADGGYTTRENIEKLARREIDFLGSMRWENVPSGTSVPGRLPPSAFLYRKESLCSSRGQSPAPARATPEAARASLLPLRSQSRGLPKLHSQTGVLSGK